jgi:hypothetical protein
MDFLKEVLSVYGESVLMEMVWLSKTETAASGGDDDYELVVKSSSLTSDGDCLNPILERFGMKAKKQGELWIFSQE